MRSKTTLLLSVAIGIVAMLMVFSYVQSRESQLLQLAEMKDVLVAREDILPNTVIDETVVMRIQVPSTYLQPKAVADLREAVGRVVTVPVPKGAHLLGTYLEEAGRTALAYDIARGTRGITLAVSDVTGVAGLVRPGNFVDIFGTFNFGRPVGIKEGQMQYADEKTETRLLLQNVRVVAVGREHRRDRPQPRRVGEGEGTLADMEAQEAEAARQRRESTVANVTVLVGPQQAQELVLAQELGTLTLALRSNLDAGLVVDLGSLDALGLLKVPIPVKPRSRPAWREIRGSPVF